MRFSFKQKPEKPKLKVKHESLKTKKEQIMQCYIELIQYILYTYLKIDEIIRTDVIQKNMISSKFMFTEVTTAR